MSLLLVLIHQKGAGQVAKVQLHGHTNVHLFSVLRQIIFVGFIFGGLVSLCGYLVDLFVVDFLLLQAVG